MNSAQVENEPGIALGMFLMAVLAALFISILVTGFQVGPVRPGINAILLGIYIMAWGGMFLASYFFSHKTFFFRALMWLCEHGSHPKGRGMAFFYAALAFFLGAAAMLSGFGVIDAT